MTQSSITPSTSNGASPLRARLSKKARALTLYEQYHDLPSNQIIDILEKELELPKNSAITYLSACRKELNPKFGKEFKTRKRARTDLIRDKAFRIYVSHPDKDRATVMKIMEAELNISPASAATHCSLAKRAQEAGTLV